MRNLYSIYTIALLAIFWIALDSCNKRVDGIDNNVVIETPYTLYFCDSSGALYNTNDGIGVKKMVFTADGSLPRAICLSGTDILWVKMGMYISQNNGQNFNSCAYFDPAHTPNNPILFFDINPASLNQSLVLNSQDENLVYVCTSTPRAGSVPGIGVAYSNQNGNAFTWVIDTNYNNFPLSTSNVAISSLTELANNTIVGYDTFTNQTYTKASATAAWFQQKQTVALPLPCGGFTLGHFNNMLVAIDNVHGLGAYYSNDFGQTWAKFSGLPAGRNLYSVASPFDQVLLVGTDSMGVYKLTADNSTVFSSANIGMESFATVRGIAAKSNIYKEDGKAQLYIFLATDKGLFKSVDLGQSWIRVQAGNFVAAY